MYLYEEKDRDWLLKKLREEKRRYNYLKEERLKFAAMAGQDAHTLLSNEHTVTTISNDSSYSIELHNDKSAQHAVQSTIASKVS
jgi:hypothetical protein